MRNIFNKSIGVVFVLILSFTSVMAQHFGCKENEKKYEAFEAEKVAFFTQQLKLTPSEAALFWPVYSKYDKKKMEVSLLKREFYRFKGNADSTLTDKQALEAISKLLTYEEEVFEAKENCYHQLIKILPPKKVLLVEVAEQRFHRQLFNKLKHRPRQEKGSPEKGKLKE